MDAHYTVAITLLFADLSWVPHLCSRSYLLVLNNEDFMMSKLQISPQWSWQLYIQRTSSREWIIEKMEEKVIYCKKCWNCGYKTWKWRSMILTINNQLNSGHVWLGSLNMWFLSYAEIEIENRNMGSFYFL